MTRNLTIKSAVGVGLMMFTIPSIGAQPQKAIPHNEVVVGLDDSVSYLRRQQEALERVSSFLRRLELQPESVWQEDADTITIVSIDAMPTVLWHGSPSDLRKVESDGYWSKLLESRSDYAGCTDVLAAFQLATHQFSASSADIHKYLLVFSDLISEPPTTTVRRCARPQTAPPQGIPWGDLRDVSVSAFWVPPNSTLEWSRAISAKGLSDNFRLYSDSEAEGIEIPPPPRASHKVTQEEDDTARHTLGNWLGDAFWVIGGGALLLFTFAVLAAFLLRRRARALAGNSGARVRPKHVEGRRS